MVRVQCILSVGFAFMISDDGGVGRKHNLKQSNVRKRKLPLKSACCCAHETVENELPYQALSMDSLL